MLYNRQSSEFDTDYSGLAHSTMVPRNTVSPPRKKLITEKQAMFLKNPQGEGYLLVANNSLILVTWKISGRTYFNHEFHRQLLHLSPIHEGQALTQTQFAWVNGLTGVSRNSLIHFGDL